MRAAVLLLCLFGAVTMTSAAPEMPGDSFLALREAYRLRDPAAAAAAYGENAEVVYRYEGAPVERYRGRQQIAESFSALFGQIDKDQPLDLNFRTTEKTVGGMAGIYRFRIGDSTSYGRFAVTLGADGRFAADESRGATLADFEEAAGPVMFAAEDEQLDRGFYGQLTGRYRLPDGCDLVVTRSVVRLFVRNSCTGEWRGAVRVAGRKWSAGEHVLPGDGGKASYEFAPIVDGVSPALRVVDAGSETREAVRATPYRTETVSFRGSDGVALAGTIYLPVGATERRPASVIIHGSGPQDRDGYASIIAVLADEMAANGRVVLTYDKRGSGGSDGDGARAGFDVLAADAAAGMALLASRPEVDARAIGLAGSSQAGWVAAKAIADGAAPADVLLLGAAGAALTVPEQNLYNVGVQMRCAGFAPSDVDLALDQQRAFFAYLADPATSAALDALSEKGRARPGLADWLFPDSRAAGRDGSAWYDVLDPRFDPLPVWRGYRGRTLFLFGERDDSTPTDLVSARLKNSRITQRTIAGAQHLGLAANDVCKAGLADVDRFAPGLFTAIATFAQRETG